MRISTTEPWPSVVSRPISRPGGANRAHASSRMRSVWQGEAWQHGRTDSVSDESRGDVQCRPNDALHGKTAPWYGHEEGLVEKELPQQGGRNLFCEPGASHSPRAAAGNADRPFFLERAHEPLRSARHLTRPPRRVDEEGAEADFRKQLLPVAEARAATPAGSARHPQACGRRTRASPWATSAPRCRRRISG